MHTLSEVFTGICLSSLILISLCFFSGCINLSEEKIIYLENVKLRLGFDKNCGSLLEMRDQVQSVDFLATDSISSLPWEIILQEKGESIPLDPGIPIRFFYRKRGETGLTMTWKVKGKDLYPSFSVIANIDLVPHSARSIWKISVDGIPNDQLYQVVFPNISGIREGGNERMAVPFWMGQEMKDPRKFLSAIKAAEKKFEWEYPGQLSMQFFSLYNPWESGFYVSSLDTLAFRKNYSVSLDSMELLNFRIVNFPSLDKSSDKYSPPYETVIACFTGDWITSAEIYRDWANQQSWCRESRFKNGQSPEWLDSTALWVWNRGRSEGVLGPAADLRQRLGLPVNVFWHWWHGCPYDIGFPEYFPPREGREPFINAISKARKKNIHSIIYMNVLQWGTSTKSWVEENAQSHAVRNLDGSLRSHVYNIFTGQSLTNMCIATSFWKDKYTGLAMKAIKEYGLNGIYMDQACLSRMCYSADHDHKPGGGNYWVQHFGNLAGMIREKIPLTDLPVLAGEGGGESWIPFLDAFLTLQVSKERYAGPGIWETLPLFQAVYHPYAVTYGNYSSLVTPPYDERWPEEFAPKDPLALLDEAFNEQFLMEQARSFVWGMQPAIANYLPVLAEKRKKEIGYLIRLAKIRQKGLKFLHYGKFMRPPELEVPKKELDISRLSIYAGRGKDNVTSYRAVYPQVFTGTWKAEDKSVGIALASISPEPCPLFVDFSAAEYDLPETGTVYLIDIGPKRQLTTYSGGRIRFSYDLPPEGLAILEITGTGSGNTAH